MFKIQYRTSNTYIIILLVTLCGCTHRSQVILKSISVSSAKPALYTLENPPINIWIHGTLLIRHRLFVEAFGSTTGLRKASTIEERFFTHKIATILHEKDPLNYPLETFYAFGWSGKLSNQQRLNAADILYLELIKIIDEYIAIYGTYPVIRLITHSHGGNVALNLAFIEDKYHKNLLIDSLVLLACPVQKNTMPCTKNIMFKHIYSLYSSLDMIQIIAPQTCNERLPFSGREFPAALNIVQAKVRMNGHAILHTEFTSARFIKTIPVLLNALQKFEQTEHHKAGKRIVLRIQTKPKRKTPLHLKQKLRSTTSVPLAQ